MEKSIRKASSYVMLAMVTTLILVAVAMLFWRNCYSKVSMLRKGFRVSYSDISYAVQEKKQNQINRRSDCPFVLITNGARKICGRPVR